MAEVGGVVWVGRNWRWMAADPPISVPLDGATDRATDLSWLGACWHGEDREHDLAMHGGVVAGSRIKSSDGYDLGMSVADRHGFVAVSYHRGMLVGLP